MSATDDAGTNVIQFRPRVSTLIEINSPIPTTAMNAEDYEAAWRTLCCYADEARTYRDYVEARWLVLRRTDEAAAEVLGRDEAFQRMRAFVDFITRLPVPVSNATTMRRYIERKKQIIGKVWLRAVGERYDDYRASVAADEARLQATGRA